MKQFCPLNIFGPEGLLQGMIDEFRDARTLNSLFS